MEGWIKLHRKVKYWDWYTDSNTFRLFIHCLLSANVEPKSWKGVNIKRGQFVTSTKKLCSDLDLTPQKIRTSLKRLKSTNEITIKTTSKYTVITVVSYDSFQSANKQLTNKQQTTNKQLTTTKEGKERKEGKEVYRAFAHLSISVTEYNKLFEFWTKEQINEIMDRIENYKNNTKYKSLYLTAKNWLKSEPKKIKQPKQDVSEVEAWELNNNNLNNLKNHF